ncbi:uncharacterized protein BXZ73DRAFT_91806 [Epithele typhae]|uniref:uncharacterized protein n=1 Tax=Epithele typhae TaxID=378194 RepID=UPI002008683F|nr:uncharacterized protein BXZ73DRAFT_91806 [Epithele typhae]KAH9921550.1 hypothetical protein BXZ73DRAFT_91806 [Epithele typhae]
MAGRALAIVCALLPAAVSAYSNTHPVLVWSSHQYLHASDLRALAPSCHTAKALSKAPSTLHLPYVPSDGPSTNPFVDMSSMLSKRCGSHAVSHSPDAERLDIDAGKGKHVVTISLPPLESGEVGASRKHSMASHESWLSEELSKIEAVFSNYLVIYSGSPGPSSTFEEAQVAPSPSGGILKRYQLLTPGLILVLLVVFLILIPIQSPLTNDIPKGFSAEEKKNQ